MHLWSFGLMERREAFQFHIPSSLLVVGPSGCEKTVFSTKMLLNNLDLFHFVPSQIHYCYGAWQDRFQPMKEQGIKFHEGVPATHQLKTWFPNGGLLVLDDLMPEGGNDKRVLDLFNKYSHHQSVTVLYLCQDVFPPGKYAKSISRNVHCIVAFKNPRDQLGMRILLLQAFVTPWQVLQGTFQRLTEHPFRYMVLDLHPGSLDDQRSFSHLLKDEGYMRCHKVIEKT